MESYRKKDTLKFEAHEENISEITKERCIALTISLLPSTQMTTLTKHIA